MEGERSGNGPEKSGGFEAAKRWLRRRFEETLLALGVGTVALPAVSAQEVAETFQGRTSNQVNEVIGPSQAEGKMIDVLFFIAQDALLEATSIQFRPKEEIAKGIAQMNESLAHFTDYRVQSVDLIVLPPSVFEESSDIWLNFKWVSINPLVDEAVEHYGADVPIILTAGNRVAGGDISSAASGPANDRPRYLEEEYRGGAAVNLYRCASGGRTLSHELGHILGAGHHKDTGDTPGIFLDSRAGGSPDFPTICGGFFGEDLVQERFSHEPGANNQKAIEFVLPYVAGYRDRVKGAKPINLIQEGLPFPLDVSPQAWGEVKFRFFPGGR